MAIGKELKQNVNIDWESAFPQLDLFSSGKLYKIVGPMIIGLELKKLPVTNEYRPYFVVYPLWEKDAKSCLEFPVIIREFYDNRGFQYSIPYERHADLINSVSGAIRGKIPLSFDGDLSLQEVFSYLTQLSQERPLSAAPNSYLQAELQGVKMKVALYVSTAKALNVFDEISKRSWDVTHFKACSVDVDKWIQGLQDDILRRVDFLGQINFNKQEKKIARMKSSDVVDR